jgi:hypothetical protein
VSDMLYTNNFYTNNSLTKSNATNKRSTYAPIIRAKTRSNNLDIGTALNKKKYYFNQHALSSIMILICTLKEAVLNFDSLSPAHVVSVSASNKSANSRNVRIRHAYFYFFK